MRKKLYAYTAALFLASLPLAACSGSQTAAPQTQSIATSQEDLASGSQGTTLTVTQTASTEATIPSAGESVEIASQASSAASAYISETDAKKIVFDHAGVVEADVTGLRIRLDRDDGRQVYEIEFYSADQEYDYEIDAADGSILSFQREMNEKAWAQNSSSAAQGAALSEADARSLALAQVPGAVEDNIVKFELDHDDGRSVYEIKIVSNNAKYEIKIDANTGEILKLEMD